MKTQDDYVAGPHHFWLHFCCGLVFGAGLGWAFGSWLFDGGWRAIVVAAVVAVGVAYSCGRWGDRAWRWILDSLTWFL